MTKEKALVMALRIVEICQEYGASNSCRQCPFNIGGCIVTDGNNTPEEWYASELITQMVLRHKEDEDDASN